MTDIHPVKPIIETDLNWLSLLLILGLFLGLVALIYWLINYRTSRQTNLVQVSQPSAVDYYQSALDAIQALQSINQPADLKSIHVSLTAVIKTYLSRHYRLNGADMTTSQLVQHISLNQQHLNQLNRLLNELDLVKFANQPSTVDQTQSLLTQTSNLITALHQPLKSLPN